MSILYLIQVHTALTKTLPIFLMDDLYSS